MARILAGWTLKLKTTDFFKFPLNALAVPKSFPKELGLLSVITTSAALPSFESI